MASAALAPIDDMPAARARHAGLDAMRYLLVLPVIAIHMAVLLPPADRGPWTTALLTFCNGAVPAYLVTSGYLMRWRGRGAIECIVTPAMRLLPVFVFWLGAYLALVHATTDTPWRMSLGQLLAGGPAFHLWFLPALGFALALNGLLLRFAGPRWAGAVCVGLAVLGLARGPYGVVAGIATGERGGLLAAPLLVFVGAMLAERQRMGPAVASVAIAAAALVIAVVENLWLARALAAPAGAAFPFTAATFLWGPALFLLGASLTMVPTWIARQSRVSLGVYALHLMVIWLVTDRIGGGGIVLLGAETLLVFALASIVARVMATVPLLRQVVS